MQAAKQTIKRILTSPFIAISLLFIFLYKLLISPFLPNTCRFYPTCSTYAKQAIISFGFFKGSVIVIKRLLRCRGKNKGGCDYIPCNIKREFKWLI